MKVTKMNESQLNKEEAIKQAQELLASSPDADAVIYGWRQGNNIVYVPPFAVTSAELADEYKRRGMIYALHKGRKQRFYEVYPSKGENKEDFIARFMSETKDEYPDRKQRYAVALSYWDRRKKNEDFEDDEEITTSEQEYTSAKTSINSAKLPAIFHLAEFNPDTINLDYGGGKFDNAAEYLNSIGVTNLVYDPYNRTSEHNMSVLKQIRKNNGADTATLSNVLNVIKEEYIRQEVLSNIKKLLKDNGILYITVYEGDGSGRERPTAAGYQLNRKTADYLDEIRKVFPNVVINGKLITAKNY